MNLQNPSTPEQAVAIAVMGEFATMQQEHRGMAEAGRLGGTADCWQKRQALFARLTAVVDEALAVLRETGGEAAGEMRQAFVELLRQEEELGQAVIALRDQMEKQLAALRSGKKTLSGYGRSQPGSFRPRFLSSRT